MDKCKCLKENWIGWTTVKCCNLCGNPIEKFWEKQQTPITPESLEGIGFKGVLQWLCLNLSEDTYIHYKVGRNKFSLVMGINMENIHFGSMEQLTEWLKPFTKGEHNG